MPFKFSGLTSRSNPRIAWNQKIANEYFSFFIHVHIWLLNKNQIRFFILFSFFLFFLRDIDECKTYPRKCHVNVTCNNTNGSYVCKCKPSYTGDGRFDYYNEFCCFFLFRYRGKPSFNFCNIDRGSYPSFEVITENLFSTFEKISCFRNQAKGWQQP